MSERFFRVRQYSGAQACRRDPERVGRALQERRGDLTIARSWVATAICTIRPDSRDDFRESQDDNPIGTVGARASRRRDLQPHPESSAMTLTAEERAEVSRR